jgi:hypothetical protein
MAGRYNSIPDPRGDVESLRQALLATKEVVEVMASQRGSRGSGAVTWDDLIALGIVDGEFSPPRSMSRFLMNSIYGRSYPCDVSGTAGAIVLTPRAKLDMIEDGMEFEFVPLTTSGLTLISIEVAGLCAATTLKAPNGRNYALWGDIQAGMPTRVKYNAALGVFILQSTPHSYKQSLFGNGAGKLQVDGATSISWTQDDGQGLMLQNPDSLAMIMVATPTVTNNNLFGNVNYVDGVANQPLAGGQHYCVYMHLLSADNDQDVRLEFWATYDGGGQAWVPTTNEWGIYVKPTAAGGSTPDNSRTYLGALWADSGGDVSISLNGTWLRSFCQSHYNLWQFPMMSSVVTTAGFTTASNGVQATPLASIVTDGVEMTPKFTLLANYRNDTVDAGAGIRIAVNGISYDGSAFAATSPWTYATTARANGYIPMVQEWGVATPRGIFTAQPEIEISGGTAQFEVSMNVLFAT